MNIRTLVERVLWDRGRWAREAGLPRSTFTAPILPPDSPHYREPSPAVLTALADALKGHADACRTAERELRKEARRRSPP